MRVLMVVALTVFLACQAEAAPVAAQAICDDGDVPILDILYFPDGTVAEPGCYPLADRDDLIMLADLRPRPRCRPAYPNADIRDDVLANTSACVMPDGIVITTPGDVQALVHRLDDYTNTIGAGRGGRSPAVYAGPDATSSNSAGLANAERANGGPLPIASSGGATGNPVWVETYTTRNGTTVQGHYRTAGDSTTANNYSTRGNVNPFTGRPGTRSPSAPSRGGRGR